jgi:putative flippase GtrA
MRRRVFELMRYVVNGVIATAVHYTVLTIGIEIVHLKSVGFATLIAASCGICASFLGNRYFVFPASGGRFSAQAAKFVVLYGALALLNGSFMYIWSDVHHLDYRYGFVLATAVQFVLSYLGGRFVVFRKASPA